jgi:hypothetical protein
MPTIIRTMCRLSIPARLKEDIMFKQAFDVPNTEAGAHFLGWWEKAEPDSRDRVMKLAHEQDIPVTEALAKLAHAPFEDDE